MNTTLAKLVVVSSTQCCGHNQTTAINSEYRINDAQLHSYPFQTMPSTILAVTTILKLDLMLPQSSGDGIVLLLDLSRF